MVRSIRGTYCTHKILQLEIRASQNGANLQVKPVSHSQVPESFCLLPSFSNGAYDCYLYLNETESFKTKKKQKRGFFFFLNYSCVPRVNIPCKAVLYNTCSVYGTICVPVHHVPAAVSFCRTRVTRNLGKVGAGGGEFEIILKETKMKKRDNGRPGLSCSKAD